MVPVAGLEPILAKRRKIAKCLDKPVDIDRSAHFQKLQSGKFLHETESFLCGMCGKFWGFQSCRF
jgi:hypothetical protein